MRIWEARIREVRSAATIVNLLSAMLLSRFKQQIRVLPFSSASDYLTTIHLERRHRTFHCSTLLCCDSRALSPYTMCQSTLKIKRFKYVFPHEIRSIDANVARTYLKSLFTSSSSPLSSLLSAPAGIKKRLCALKINHCFFFTSSSSSLSSLSSALVVI